MRMFFHIAKQFNNFIKGWTLNSNQKAKTSKSTAEILDQWAEFVNSH